MCLKYNSSLAAEYMSCFKQMEEQFGIKNDVTVSGLARMPEVLTMDQAPRMKTGSGSSFQEPSRRPQRNLWIPAFRRVKN